MNYERIILELMERIQILEEKVAVLEGHSAPSAQPEPEQKSGITARARAYIAAAKSAARAEGKSELILVCNDIQRILDVTNRAPAGNVAMLQGRRFVLSSEDKFRAMNRTISSSGINSESSVSA